MTQPVQFTSSTARFSLPQLFSGQAQKEFFVNEAHALIDALLHSSVEGVANAPPASQVEGECWLVSTAPTGDWSGHSQQLAIYFGSSWTFVAPQVGMMIHDKASGQVRRFDGSWNIATAPVAPQGGATVDAEARTAIASLIEALEKMGILAPSP